MCAPTKCPHIKLRPTLGFRTQRTQDVFVIVYPSLFWGSKTDACRFPPSAYYAAQSTSRRGGRRNRWRGDRPGLRALRIYLCIFRSTVPRRVSGARRFAFVTVYASSSEASPPSSIVARGAFCDGCSILGAMTTGVWARQTQKLQNKGQTPMAQRVPNNFTADPWARHAAACKLKSKCAASATLFRKCLSESH